MHGLTRGRAVVRPSSPGAAEDRPAAGAARAGWTRALPVGGEALTAFLAAAVLLQLSRTIDVDPLDRVGQVSGLAGIGLRFSVLGLALLAIVVVAQRWRGGTLFPLVSRLACAAVAGLASGFVGGGLLVALDGTTWPLFADRGDAGQLTTWVTDLLAGGSMPASYPPLAVHLMVLWSDVTGAGAAGSVRALQILGTAVFGPLVYLAWRILLSPPWALALGLTSALVLIDPYKPYGPVVLAVLIPVLIKLLAVLRRAAVLRWPAVVGGGVLFGVVLGLLFLLYSGWFVWSAAGTVAATLVLFPWRSGLVRGLVLLVVTTVTFAGVALPHLLGLLGASGTVKDRYFYFDVYVEPAYVAMWRGDLPGNPGPWPPPGELGGVGVFSLILVVGLGLAIWLAGRRTVVVGLSLFLASAWITRFWFASQMYGTGSVQLYPRTTQQILYCSLLLVGFAVYFGIERLRAAGAARRLVSPAVAPGADGEGVPRAHPGTAVLGTLAAALVLALFSGSATADRFMPRSDNSVGLLAYVAQMVRQTDGECPDHSGPGCASTSDELMESLTPPAGTPPAGD